MSRISKRSFTLLELIIVIAILGILLTLLLPSLSKSKEQARSSICKSNLYQYFQAHTQIMKDRNHKWYSNDRFRAKVEKYLGTGGTSDSAVKCPTRDFLGGNGTYARNGNIGGQIDYTYQVNQADSVLLFSEKLIGGNGREYTVSRNSISKGVAIYHLKQSANVASFDGSVRQSTRAQVQADTAKPYYLNPEE